MTARRSAPPLRITVVGSGPHFLSGISYYTHGLSVALTGQASVSVLLMRRLIPRRLYPGRDHVGKQLVRFEWPGGTDVYDGIDWWWLPSVVPALWRLARHRPHVVVLQWWTGAVLHTHLLLALVARLLGAQVVIEFHEVQDIGELAVPIAGSYVRRVIPALLRLASGFVVHSEFDRGALEERYGLAGKPVTLVPHALYDAYRPLSTGPLARPAEGQTDDICRLLYFGVIRPFKGVEDLVRAFDGLDDDEAARFTLTVVGETWEGWTLPGELIGRSPRRDRITFVNRYVADDEVGGLFDAADVIVLPYHRSSSSGPLQIAMGAGKPVVVTSVGGLVEAAGDYPGAVWVPPKDPVALRDGLRAAARLRGKTFDSGERITFERAAELYVDFLAGLGVRR